MLKKVEMLCHVCQLSLDQGVFPNELKIARVIPLYKGGNRSHIVNYRPLSVLPVFSKVLEKLMFNRVVDYINLNDILYKLQFGSHYNGYWFFLQN